MSRTFLYARVSTSDQTTDNQLEEVKSAGFEIAPFRVVTETVSCSIPTSDRKAFTALMQRMEPGDILLVTKLDRLGRNAMDVRTTVENLANLGIKVHCLALGGVDLTSPAGKMTMSVIAAVAEFERDLLIERTASGLDRAKAQGKKLGRPIAASTEQVKKYKSQGNSQSETASSLGVSLSTVKRLWNK
ncbi:recombinase family protein [Pseudomonas sp. 148P]|uniref:Recombinase family protein n=1 Tax=Pseudomonas ulcerans TaxID=3115852 RepID=A0ABU7HQY8_9PSED|nr:MULTISPECIES: recombinase family protein [unclassified Pseudomonas]MEE1925449.1 recombinase family protein [Pseudomonas sp. 147P]MEE1933903.1 recombinase family protein [Pseudomonas sp. 148P]